jgi:hypothetical protein
MTSEMKSYSRLGKIGEEDDKLRDYAEWERLGNEERFRVTWELVVQAWEIQGKSLDELRFQRSVTRIERRKS